jgi:hypothetical protein
MVERVHGLPSPHGVAVCGAQLESQLVRAVASRGVSVDREPDVGGELRDRYVTHRADDDELARPIILRDLTADHERLYLRWR